MFFKTNSESEIIKVWKSVNSLLNEVKAYEVNTYKNVSFLGHPVCTVSALEVFHVMRYTNLRLLTLLTYLPILPMS